MCSANNKISVIIPVYNLENYITRTLDSVCAQSYDNLEIIVVDDGSTDSTLEVIMNYSQRDNRIVPIHQDNQGVTAARLNGVKHATGEWIGFVDGDDLVDEDMYEFLLNNAVKYNAQISHCGYKMFFLDGRINFFHNSGIVILQDNIKGLKDLLDASLVEPGLWNKIFHRSLFELFFCDKSMDYSLKNNEDLLMNYILFKYCNKSVFEDKCLYNYFVRENSASRMINLHTIYDPIKVKQIICDISPEELKPIAEAGYLSTCINVYRVLVANGNYNDELYNIYDMIYNAKSFKKNLSKNMRMLCELLLINRTVFNILYKMYSKYFQRSKYE